MCISIRSVVFWGVLALFAGVLIPDATQAQTFNLDDPMGENLRRRQVIDGSFGAPSWTIRPVSFDLQKAFYSSQFSGVSDSTTFATFDEVYMSVIYNSKVGYGRNMGLYYPERGVADVYGIKARLQFQNIQIDLNPLLMRSQNRDFQELPITTPDWYWDIYYREYLNRIDNPERLRTYPYMLTSMGHSSVSYTWRDHQVMVSSRNIWWGPAKRNSLIMSNNAPGFLHLSFNSRVPIGFRFGNLEYQVIWGRLNESGTDPVPPRLYTNFQPMPYRQKPDDWRLLSGFALTWQPKWVNGLSVGLARTVMTYSQEIKRFDHLFSFLRRPYMELPYGDGMLGEQLREIDIRDRFDGIMIGYIRYVNTAENMEAYAEWGRRSRPGNFQDFLRFPFHTMGYTIGIEKLYPITANDSFIGIEAEITQLERTETWRVRSYTPWYVSENIPHGYTHRGQILGAAIGPGANSQYLGFNYIKDNNRVGIYGERHIYNNDLYYRLFTTSLFRHWADINFGVVGDYRWKRLEFSGKLQVSRMMNYKYIEVTTRPGYQYLGLDLTNVHVVTSVRYRF
jgi:hypothetical protein